MKIVNRPFDIYLDLPILDTWLKARDLPRADARFLPPTGYLTLVDDVPVACGFMVKCDNRTAIYQDFVSDPESDKMVRNRATESLRAKLDDDAKSFGIQVILCTTAHKEHSRRLKELGYNELERNLIQLGRFLWL